MSTKIPATIVTGFLGAGKTSLVRHLVENAGGAFDHIDAAELFARFEAAGF